MNQSAVDMCASFFTLLTAVFEVDYTRMSRASVWNRCPWRHAWHT